MHDGVSLFGFFQISHKKAQNAQKRVGTTDEQDGHGFFEQKDAKKNRLIPFFTIFCLTSSFPLSVYIRPDLKESRDLWLKINLLKLVFILIE